MIERFVKQLESPFGFLDTVRDEAMETDDDQEDVNGQPKS